MNTKNGISTPNELEPYLESLSAVSDLLDESVYVVDFQQRCFRFVSDKGIFLCDRSPEDVVKAGYDFYSDLILSDDYPLAQKLYKAIVRYFSHPDISLSELAFIKFNLRLQSNKRLMMKHKVTPLLLNNHAKMAVCTVSHTMSKTPGNLVAFYKNKDVCFRYSLNSDQWMQEPMIILSPREKRILELFKVGMSRKDVADAFCISFNTLRNIEASIYNKLNVKSMIQAVNLASNRRLIFAPECNGAPLLPEQQINGKKVRRMMTSDKLLRIQEAMNNGMSINSIAKQENVSEFTIRYSIKTGKLKKNNS